MWAHIYQEDASTLQELGDEWSSQELYHMFKAFHRGNHNNNHIQRQLNEIRVRSKVIDNETRSKTLCKCQQ